MTPAQIADRLHDTVCQSVTGARLLLSVVPDQLPQDATHVRRQIETVDGVLGEAGAELRALMMELRTAAEKDRAE